MRGGGRGSRYAGRRELARLAGLGLLLLLLACAAAPVAAAAAESPGVEIITSPDRSQVVVDRALLRAIFTMRLRQWPDGQPLRVFVLADSNPLHDRFCREMLGTYPYVLRNSWDRMVYTGTGFAPVTVSSEEEMRRRVQATPGAIGYVASPGRESRGTVKGAPS